MAPSSYAPSGTSCSTAFLSTVYRTPIPLPPSISGSYFSAAAYHENLFRITPVSTTKVRYLQDSGGGASGSPNIAWLNELEAYEETAGSVVTYTHDSNGNVTKRQTDANNFEDFGYDYANRLNLYKKTTSGSLTVHYTYLAAPTGDRFRKRNELATGGTIQDYQFVYDARDAVADYEKPANGSLAFVRDYVQGLDIDSKIARIESDGTARYYAGDALGSVTHLLDSAAAILNTTLTNAWGESMVTSQPTADRFGFTQRENDSESSLMHYRARWYDPRLGRFGGKDPVRDFFAHYVYASNNPLNRSDPMGLQDAPSSPTPWWQKEYAWYNPVGIAGDVVRWWKTGSPLVEGGASMYRGGDRVKEAWHEGVTRPSVHAWAIAATGGVAGTWGGVAGMVGRNALMGVTVASGDVVIDGIAYGQVKSIGHYATTAGATAVVGLLIEGAGAGIGRALRTPVAVGMEAPAKKVNPQPASTPGVAAAAKPGIAAEEMVTVYRGISKDHPAFNDALQGRATPRGGHSDPRKHNQWDTRSEFTSWTTNRQIAEMAAGKDGVVLEKQIPRSAMIKSPDIFAENEVLLKGPVEGAKVQRGGKPHDPTDPASGDPTKKPK
jgi:RHS repeat-associated protein